MRWPPCPHWAWDLWVCFSYALHLLALWFLLLPKSSIHTIFLFEESGTIQTNCFLLSKNKGKRKKEKESFRPLVRLKEEEKHKNHKGKRKTQFLRKRK